MNFEIFKNLPCEIKSQIQLYASPRMSDKLQHEIHNCKYCCVLNVMKKYKINANNINNYEYNERLNKKPFT